MKKETSSGGVIYTRENGDIEFLLIRGATTGWWVFPKGHVEAGESLIETAIREIKEETGLEDFFLKEGFHEDITFINLAGNEKTVHHFLFESSTRKVKLSDEHIDFKWLNFDGAVELVDHENQKRILRKAFDFIDENE